MELYKRRKEDSFFGRVFNFVKRFFIVIGISVTISSVFLFITLNKVVNHTPSALPDSMILTYTFKTGLTEKVIKPSFSQPLLRPGITFHEVIDDLTQASKDPRVKGFVAKMRNIDMTPAQIQELRNVIINFSKAGKFTKIFAEDFGGFSSGMGDYYLASAFDEIWLQPVGAVAINGISAEIPFFKKLMDKIGVEADFGHKGKYKSAPESLTEIEMTKPHREMMTGLIKDLSDQLVTDIASRRKMTVPEMWKVIDNAPYHEVDAKKLNLVNQTGYYNQLIEAAKKKAHTEKTKLITLSGYSFKASTISLNKGISGFTSQLMHKADPGFVHRNKAKIALIFGSGDIVSYKSTHAGFGERGMSADKIVEAFADAQKDEDVVAVVFRVDSPGGSPAAAETIRRAVIEIQQTGRPVIVSMGGYAASGGYWVATSADKIVAEPATITGSIGVFGGKFVVKKLMDKLGVHWDHVSVGENARMWSSNKSFSKAEKTRFDAMLGHIYESFITRVMEGRKMTRAEVMAVAEGHVWTGRQAKERGLVDVLGGLDKAVELAKAAALLPPEQDVPVERFPPQKSTIEMFMDLAMEGVSFKPNLNISVKDLLKSFEYELQEEAALLKSPKVSIH